MNEEEIIEIQTNSALNIFGALKTYVDFLEEVGEKGAEKIKKNLLKPEKEAYQICITVLVGLMIGRLGDVENDKRTESLANAVAYFDMGLERSKQFKDKIFPNLDLAARANGALSACGNEALKWSIINMYKKGERLISTGGHMAMAIKLGKKTIQDDEIYKIFKKKGSFCVVGENYLMGLFFALTSKDLKIN